MSKTLDSSGKKLAFLQKFLDQNPDLGIENLDLQAADISEQFQWKGLSRQRKEVLEQLRGYQRLLKINPAQEQQTLMHLLQEGIHSALQIAALPLPRFIEMYGGAFGGDAEAATVYYQRAAAIRSRILLEYMAIKQGHEPHVRSSRVKTGA
jgi:hypothetical protein